MDDQKAPSMFQRGFTFVLKGDVNVVSVKIGKSRLSLIQGDLTKQPTQAIVNAANSSLMGGGGVDGAIHRAGGSSILKECQEIVARDGRLPTGQAVVTTGGRLLAKYVIHTVGPVWTGGRRDEPKLLADCYRNSLRLAQEKGIRTVSFPSISTGAFRYPVEQAAKVAVKAVVDFLRDSEGIDGVIFVLFDTSTYRVYEDALKAVKDNRRR